MAHLVSGAQPRLLRGIAGAVILVGVALVAAGRRVGGGPLVGGVAGAASATMNVLASTGGPAVVVYATGAGWEPSRARVSWQAYFLCLNLETTAVLGFPRLAGGSLAVLVLALLAGASVATALRGRVPARAAMATTLLLAASGGAAVLGSAILSG